MLKPDAGWKNGGCFDTIGDNPFKAVPTTQGPFPFPTNAVQYCCKGAYDKASGSVGNCNDADHVATDTPKPAGCPPGSMICTGTTCEKAPTGKMCHDKKWMDRSCDALYKIKMAAGRFNFSLTAIGLY